ncbi:uncharacterized protein [Haliotis asinina]|uniref:uncharacterized protein n=1 Tax=Haliotis asinina TaxID=109174 RepID=UPI003531E041
MHRIGIDVILSTICQISILAFTASTEKTCSSIGHLPVMTDSRVQGAVTETITTTGIISCAKECLSRHLCEFFNYNLDEGTCELSVWEYYGPMSVTTEPRFVFSKAEDWPKNILGACQHHKCGVNSRCVETADNGWECVITYCADPPTVEYANDVDSSVKHVTLVNQTLTLDCLVGYVPCGNMTCNPDGTWTPMTCMPVASCSEVWKLSSTYTDGEYWLYPRQVHGSRVKVYCHAMNSTPSEYIYLRTPYFMDSPMVENEDCTGETPILTSNSFLGYHVYSKFGLDIKTLTIKGTDRRFYNKTAGMDSNVGVVKDCYSIYDCGPRGQAVMDLRGTGLALDGSVTWMTTGESQTPIVTWSSNNQVIDIRCGGRCGKCVPNGPLQLVLLESDAPPDNSAITPQCDRLSPNVTD